MNRSGKPTFRFTAAFFAIAVACSAIAQTSAERFEGKHYRGAGDVEYLRLLDTARRMFEPDAELQNLAMLYITNWNGLVEGPTWDAWWIQNSYGTSLAILPLLREPFLTFLQNSQDLWFDQMGDGQRVGAKPPFNWVAPDGALCDAARPGWIVYKQGDGRVQIHDWGMEFTAAGMVLQGELLLTTRDAKAIAHYLPKLERCAAFIETRRATNNLFLAGPAGNLLAPSFAGWQKPDGSFGQAYLTGLSITYIAALDRLIELQKLAGRSAEAKRFTALRDSAKRALPQLLTDEGYFIRSLDPDGTRHGVFGAAKHGYFEASPNHDAIALRVVDDTQSEKIFRKLAAIPELRPFDFVLPNFPSYDDMYEKAEGLWGYGTWVNGGHWSTCEARMVLAYYRLGQFDDARRSMKRLLTFAERFRMDNPLTQRGNEVYQPNQPINLTYDAFGPAAAFMRGLFEYHYDADALTLVPHIPPSVTELEQLDPVRFGSKRIFVAIHGGGPITAVRINGKQWKEFDARSIRLPYRRIADEARVSIELGNREGSTGKRLRPTAMADHNESAVVAEIPLAGVRRFCTKLASPKYADCYERAHAELILDCARAAADRELLRKTGKLLALPAPAETAADRLFSDTVVKLYAGLKQHMESLRASAPKREREILTLWDTCVTSSSKN